MIQLKRPGAPVAIGGMPLVMDMFIARPAYGSPEMCLNTAAAGELAQYLNLPFMGTAGVTEGKLLDAQTGAVELEEELCDLKRSSRTHLSGVVRDGSCRVAGAGLERATSGLLV